MNSRIIYYPVDNGDQSLISVFEDSYTTNILIDCRIRENSKDENDETKFDVKAGLLETLQKKTINDIEGVKYVDIFVLTHGDDDHIHGYEKNFYQGDPQKFKKSNKENEEIFIDVLWFSPMVNQEHTNDDEKCFNKEAERRIKLHRDKSPDKDLPGNRIVIIGYDANEDLSGLDLVRATPGNIISRFNDKELKTFSIFIHAPFKKQLIQTEPDKNHTSIVFQARFKEKSDSTDFCALAMFGGDADHYAWALILNHTMTNKNDVKYKALDWDLFLAPHHCSWTFFNDTSDVSGPVDSSLEILRFRKPGGKIIASSKVIKKNGDDPPSYKARNHYIKELEKEDNFLNTAVEPDEKSPEPIIFLITPKGPVRPPTTKISGSLTSAGGKGAPATIVKQG